MNAFTRFAVAMSEQLFTMRSEDLMNSSLYRADQHGDEFIISQEYIDKVLYDPAHAGDIKERLRMSVLEDVQQNPDEYDMNGSEYVYSGRIYDHAYLVDTHIQNQYEWDHPEFHTVYICRHCGSDNVQIKAWVRPNTGFKFVDEPTGPNRPGFCTNCLKHVMIDTAEIDTRHRIIGFQVVSEGNDEVLHPAITDYQNVYDNVQGSDMVRDMTIHEDGFKGTFKLKAMWSDQIREPNIMFTGDPQK